MAGSMGGTEIGRTSRVLRLMRPSRSLRIAATPDMSSVNRLRFFVIVYNRSCPH